jgi:hypothetical protein
LLLVSQLKEYNPGWSVHKGKAVSIGKKEERPFARGQRTAVVLITKEGDSASKKMAERLKQAARRNREFRFAIQDKREAKKKPQRLPALVLYRDGKEIARRAGQMSQREMEAWIKGE